MNQRVSPPAEENRIVPNLSGIPDILIGVISDTHGLLRPEAVRMLSGSDIIVHAGDVGNARILEDLRRIAPVVAVRGNVDRGDWAAGLPFVDIIEAGDSLLYILHDLHQLDLDPSAAGIQAVISGHSHRPLITTSSGVIYLNPGSAGPRRFRLPISLASIRIRGRELLPEIRVIEEA